MKVYIETHGCSMNKSDSEIMAGLLLSAGFEVVDSEEEADVIVLNTCNVKGSTEQRMIHRAKKLSSLKKPLVIAGCMAKTQPDLLSRYSKVLIGPKSIDKIVDAVMHALRGEPFVAREDRELIKVSMPRLRMDKVTSVIPVSEGCLGECSYCITRFARGRLRSYPPDLIISEIERTVKEGYPQIFLTSEDMGAYGLDIGTNLASLLEKVARIQGLFFIRVGMMNPHLVIPQMDDLLSAFEDIKFYKFFHIPVQSGSDKVLRDMRRRYSINQFLEVVDAIRRKFGDFCTISTDVIVGFPTEDEEDFQATLRVIETVKPEVINISKFAPRPLTPAALMKQLDPKVIKRRSKELSELAYRVKMSRNIPHVGREYLALVVRRFSKDLFQARTLFYRPVRIRSLDLKEDLLVKVLIEGARSNFLEGKLLEIVAKVPCFTCFPDLGSSGPPQTDTTFDHEGCS